MHRKALYTTGQSKLTFQVERLRIKLNIIPFRI
jgi:hypothetical protein